MKKIIIAVAVALAVLVVATPAALACWSVVSCNHPTGCTGTISYVQKPSVCWDAGYRTGQLHTSNKGQKCVWVAGAGSVGCTWGVKMFQKEGPEECGLEPDPPEPNLCCRSVAVVTLTGVGCCQAPCPPTIPNCSEN